MAKYIKSIVFTILLVLVVLSGNAAAQQHEQEDGVIVRVTLTNDHTFVCGGAANQPEGTAKLWGTNKDPFVCQLPLPMTFVEKVELWEGGVFVEVSLDPYIQYLVPTEVLEHLMTQYPS